MSNSYDELSITANNDFLLTKDGLLGLSDRMGNFIHPLEYKAISAKRLTRFPLWTIRNQDNNPEERILADSIQSIDSNKLLVYRNDQKVIYNNNLALSGSFEGVTKAGGCLAERAQEFLKVYMTDYYHNRGIAFVLKAMGFGELWTLTDRSWFSLCMTPYSRSIVKEPL